MNASQQQQLEKVVLGSRLMGVAGISYLTVAAVCVFYLISTHVAIQRAPETWEGFENSCMSRTLPAQVCDGIFQGLLTACRQNNLKGKECVTQYETFIEDIRDVITPFLLCGFAGMLIISSFLPCCAIVGVKSDNRCLVVTFAVFNMFSLLWALAQVADGNMLFSFALPLTALSVYLSFKLQQAQAAPPVVGQSTMVQAPVVSSYPQPVAEA
mmetsp:Transcript_94348/g.266868  ORF Transcript_94348/g.266868 Transcript_94348/m.266868 type:complete len:212 (-) Transcript_94348:117-752(-)